MREAGYGYGGMVECMWLSWDTDERALIGLVVEKLRRSAGRREGWRGRRSGGGIGWW